MKKILLASAVVAMMLSCADKSAPTTATGENAAAAQTNFNGGIAYVRMDSLMRGYGMFIDLNDEFTKKGTSVQSELERQGRSLEREIADYQDKAQKGTITRFEGQRIEEGLQKKNNDAVAYRDRMVSEMAESEQVMNNKISTAIMDYLKEYNATKGYSMIFQTMASSPILVADPALDITTEVLDELNKRYMESKNVKK